MVRSRGGNGEDGDVRGESSNLGRTSIIFPEGKNGTGWQRIIRVLEGMLVRDSSSVYDEDVRTPMVFWHQKAGVSMSKPENRSAWQERCSAAVSLHCDPFNNRNRSEVLAYAIAGISQEATQVAAGSQRAQQGLKVRQRDEREAVSWRRGEEAPRRHGLEMEDAIGSVGENLQPLSSCSDKPHEKMMRRGEMKTATPESVGNAAEEMKSFEIVGDQVAVECFDAQNQQNQEVEACFQSPKQSVRMLVGWEKEYLQPSPSFEKSIATKPQLVEIKSRIPFEDEIVLMEGGKATSTSIQNDGVKAQDTKLGKDLRDKEKIYHKIIMDGCGELELQLMEEAENQKLQNKIEKRIRPKCSQAKLLHELRRLEWGVKK